MKQRIVVSALIFVILVIILGFSFLNGKKTTVQNKPQHSMQVQQAEPNTITIEKYAFTPSPITIKKGTTITWINHDIAKHTVTADEGDKSGLASDFFGKNEKYTFTFKTAGTYHYHCDPHPYMHGIVTVTE